MFREKAYDLGAEGSCIRELHAYGSQRALEVGEENVFNFAQGNPSVPTPPELNETVLQLLQETDPLQLHGYTPAVGEMATRQAIADDLNARYDAGVTAQQLFIGCGAAPELAIVVRTLAVPGSRILAIAPFFPEYRPIVEENGCGFDVVPADEPDFQIRMDALEAMLTPDTVAVIVNSPNNPAGTVYSEETLTQLAELLQRKSEEYGHIIYIIADEPYRELTYDGIVAPFIPKFYPNTLVCYSYSKCLSLPGERIGYIYVADQATDSKKLFTALCGAARGAGHICAPSLWQKVLARCAHLRPDLSSYDRNRKVLHKALVEAGYEVAKPDGAFYLFVKAPGGDAMAFTEKAKKKDVLLVPGNDFGCPAYFRLCYCVSHEKILRSIPLFQELIREA